MNIIRFKGGLGNQMFQYAFGYAMAMRGKNVKYSTGFYRRHTEMRQFELARVFPHLNIPQISDKEFEDRENIWENLKKSNEYYAEVDYREKKLFYIEKGHSEFDDDVWNYDDCVYVGYWQSEKYFADIANQIKYLYSFRIKESALLELSNTINNRFYGVHIRRGDYLNSVHEVCDIDYYISAMNYIKESDSNARFIFFSDDSKWINEQSFVTEKDIIQSDIGYGHYCDWYDMFLMTKCKGNIISNSSFSWWGAWLAENDGIVIAPSRWYKYDAAPDIYLNGWVLI